ncbi:MAG: sulfotransferase, partial [Candidatus Rokuibacteriota bacterium]
WDGPIFIVGPSRSGTSLLRVVLSNHSRVWITRETHYFDDLRRRLKSPGVALGLGEREVCEDYFLQLGHRAYGADASTEESTISRSDLRQVAEELGCSGDAYFEAFCRIRARANGKGIWGEKTPRHVFQIDELFRLAPQARVVCLLRDPRAVVASYRDWHSYGGGEEDGEAEAFLHDQERARRSFHVGIAALLWRGAMRASTVARERHGGNRVLLLRYEQLVEEPRRAVEDLCTWLQLDFEEPMLDVPVVQSSYLSHETGISKEPLDRWRGKLSRREVAQTQSFAGRSMDDLGYEREPLAGAFPSVAWGWLTLPIAAGRAGLANRGRMGRVPGYVWRRLRVAVS